MERTTECAALLSRVKPTRDREHYKLPHGETRGESVCVCVKKTAFKTMTRAQFYYNTRYVCYIGVSQIGIWTRHRRVVYDTTHRDSNNNTKHFVYTRAPVSPTDSWTVAWIIIIDYYYRRVTRSTKYRRRLSSGLFGKVCPGGVAAK